MTSVYFSNLHAGQAHAMTVTLIAVATITALCLVLVHLLPRTATH